jgi:hypothetical protein
VQSTKLVIDIVIRSSNCRATHVISGFRRDMNETFGFLDRFTSLESTPELGYNVMKANEYFVSL